MQANFFIIFVDAIFTTLFERLFTNVFDVTDANRSKCLRVSRVQRRLTSSQPKFDTNKKDRIARMYWVRSCVALRERIDVVVRNRPKGARFASFGLGLCVFALMPTEVGYQDIASLLARQPGVAERWQKRVFSAASTIQVATYSFGRPIGTSTPQTVSYRLASLDNQGIDITGSVTRNPIAQAPPRYQASDFPKVDRTLKGDRLVTAPPETPVPAGGRALE